jgi:hypothetical protein
MNKILPEKIENLIYTHHARREQCKDLKGFIEQVPKSYYRAGCKKVFWKEEEKLEVHYVYDDHRDLVLIVNPNVSVVITVWLEFADNKNAIRGKFRFNFSKKRKTA